MMIQTNYWHPYPGVTMVQSDPIHGSLGVPKPPMSDLTPEQQFEQSQRDKKPQVYKDDKEQVTDTENSIKIAEEITGGKMPEPSDPKQKKKIADPVKYPYFDEDDEERDTVETRRSVKSTEKKLKRRFWINAREKKDYEAMVRDG